MKEEINAACFSCTRPDCVDTCPLLLKNRKVPANLVDGYEPGTLEYDRAKSRRYYWNNRDLVLAKKRAKRMESVEVSG